MPKVKGTKGGNLNPVQTPEFKAKQFSRIDAVDEPLEEKNTTVRLYASDKELLVSRYPDSKERAAFLRSLIHECLKE